ncbi:MAG: NfeD family protein [Tissierella sp.]|uniref:NfeD family protein n=1 Tax=Tissierella sp. TaxID=41274 RepID=UPI003F9B75D6
MKNKRILILIFTFLLVLGSFGFADDNSDEVYVVPINGEINRATSNFVKDAIKDANENNPKAIIFEVDTYGGLVDEAIEIKDAILSTSVPTISFVNNKAVSAGVLVTIASENVVMSTNATIGSAETIPNTEKNLSFWRSVLRDTAAYRGRDEQVIQAMADKDIEIEGLNKKGKLVNLTSSEALEYEITDHISDDYNDILSKFDIANADIKKYKESLQVKLAKYIATPALSSLLLTIAFVGLIIELLTPGFGVGGTLSVLGFGLYFAGNLLAGSSNWTSLALFITGLILMVIEGIVPGFGLPGISGIILVLVGIVLATESFNVALISLSVAIIITTIITIVLIKLGYRSKVFDAFILTGEKKKQEKYIVSRSKGSYLKKTGVAATELRPSGFINIEGERLDALSEEGFIPSGASIEVVRVEGSKIFVRRI